MESSSPAPADRAAGTRPPSCQRSSQMASATSMPCTRTIGQGVAGHEVAELVEDAVVRQVVLGEGERRPGRGAAPLRRCAGRPPAGRTSAGPSRNGRGSRRPPAAPRTPRRRAGRRERAGPRGTHRRRTTAAPGPRPDTRSAPSPGTPPGALPARRSAGSSGRSPRRSRRDRRRSSRSDSGRDVVEPRGQSNRQSDEMGGGWEEGCGCGGTVAPAFKGRGELRAQRPRSGTQNAALSPTTQGHAEPHAQPHHPGARGTARPAPTHPQPTNMRIKPPTPIMGTNDQAPPDHSHPPGPRRAHLHRLGTRSSS